MYNPSLIISKCYIKKLDSFKNLTELKVLNKLLISFVDNNKRLTEKKVNSNIC